MFSVLCFSLLPCLSQSQAASDQMSWPLQCRCCYLSYSHRPTDKALDSNYFKPSLAFDGTNTECLVSPPENILPGDTWNSFPVLYLPISTGRYMSRKPSRRRLSRLSGMVPSNQPETFLSQLWRSAPLTDHSISKLPPASAMYVRFREVW